MTRTNRNINLLISLLVTVASLLVVSFLATPKASAASIGYDPANLIGDSVFTNQTTMGVADIQNFLNSENSGLANYSDIETCTPKFHISSSFNSTGYYQQYYHCNQSESAAQIIYDVSQAYQINPQVILATLQKEQSLITTPNPIASQINYAMGYGCPDSSGCSGYGGFFNQVDSGAWQFRADIDLMNGQNWWDYTPNQYPCSTSSPYYSTGLYLGNTVSFYDDNGVQYSTLTLGGSATAALYCYTPHTYNNPQGINGNPQYGTTGMYYSGSYNFVTSFQLWFGSPFKNEYHWEPYQQSAYTDSTLSTPISLNSASNHSQRIFLSVKVLNDGKATWYPNQVNLGTSQPQNRSSIVYDSTWMSPNRPATISEQSVAPGQYGTFNFWVNTPNQAGTYKEYFNLVAEGITWMNDMGLYFQFNVSPATYTYNEISQQTYTDQTMTTIAPVNQYVQPNTKYFNVLKVQNTSNFTWVRGQINLGTSWPYDGSSQIYNSSWLSNNRASTLTEATVPPGGTGTFSFWSNSPTNTGYNKQYFDLVDDGLSWFLDNGIYFGFNVNRPYTWNLISQSAYTDQTMATPINLNSISPGQRIYLQIKALNVGTTTWQQSSLHLGTSQPNDRSSVFYDPSWISANRLFGLQETSVPPGGIGTLQGWVTAPNTPGVYKEYFNLVADNISWLIDIGLYYQFTVI